ncbi:MAG: methyltransferase domain-containing protein [Candidatus Woesearchaeota archaeon]
MERILMTEQGKRFYVKDLKQDVHTQYGFVKAGDVQKAKAGDVLRTNTGKELIMFKPSFIDVYWKIKRGAQIIPLKDMGVIITETGIGSKSRVVDAGAGSGGLACFLANIVKEVVTYDIREDFIKIVEHNKELLGLNLTIKEGNVYEAIEEKNVDLVTLDLPEPWLAVESAAKALKVGGFVMAYSPSVPQVMDFVEAVRKNEKLIFLRTLEIIEREWDVDGRKVRPKTQTIGHSGFMSFARKIRR